ncbi:MAG: Gldg family protein [Acidiferrobacterales bacterium]|nr:Gldg family protein [Acidiferrobacterales bacterium]
MRSVKFNLAGAVAVAILVFVALNLIAQQVLSKYRIDLTERGLYTLSQGTEDFLAQLQEPIQLNFFVSRSELLQTPGFNTYIGRIDEILNEYARLSGDWISVRVIDPEPFSEAEDMAVGHGLNRIAAQDGNSAYLGLVGTNSIDETHTISFFLPEREELLEYDLTRMIYRLAARKRKTVGIISTLPIQGSGGAAGGGSEPQQPPWSFLVSLNSFFDLKLLLPSDDQLPDDLDLLLLIHPKGLSDRLLYEIDQFALGGKSVLLFVDPFSETISAMLSGQTQAVPIDTGADMNRLTGNWGVTLRGRKIAGDLPIAARVLEGDGSSGRTIDYPVWMNVQPEQLNSSDPITSQLGNIILATAGVLDLEHKPGLKIERLISTSSSAKLYGHEEFSAITDIQQLLQDYQEGGEQWVVAARISGTAVTAFPDGPPDSEEAGSASDVESPRITEGEINAVVVADTDMLHDRFWIQHQQVFNQSVAFATASNGELIHNAVDNLSGDNSLLGVRSRGSYFRPFHKMQKIRQAAEQQYLANETKLLEELANVESLLLNLQSDNRNEGAEQIVTDAQREELKRMRASQIEIRQQLRDVQHKLGQDINQLVTAITVVNIIAVPLVVGLIALYMGVFGWKLRGRRLLLRVRQIEGSQ